MHLRVSNQGERKGVENSQNQVKILDGSDVVGGEELFEKKLEDALV
jgi:hypothetical protein